MSGAKIAIRPTPEVEPIVEVIGDAATLALLAKHAGIVVKIPKRATGKTALAGVIGAEAERQLVAEYGGERLSVPLAKRWRVQHLRAAGATYSEIARAVGMDEGNVGAVLRDAGMTGVAFPRRAKSKE